MSVIPALAGPSMTIPPEFCGAVAVGSAETSCEKSTRAGSVECGLGPGLVEGRDDVRGCRARYDPNRQSRRSAA